MKKLTFIIKFLSSLFNSILNGTAHSIKSKITILIVLVVLLPMTFAGVYIYFLIQDVLEESIYTSLSQVTQQANANLESNIKIIENTSMLLLCNQTIKSNLEQFTIEDGAYLRSRIKLRIEDELKYSLLFNQIWDTNLLKSVFIFKQEQTYFYLSRDLFPDSSFIEDHIDFFSALKNEAHDTSIILSSSKYPILYYMMDIKNQSTLASIGKLVLGIDQNELMKFYSQILEYPNSQAFIFNQDGTIILHTDKSMQGTKVNSVFMEAKTSISINEVEINGEVYFVSSQKISNLNLASVIMIPKNQVMNRLNATIKNYLYILVFAVIISLTISLYLSSLITKPIKDLISKLNMMKNGMFNVKMPSYGDYELNELSNVFNKMTNEIHYLFQQVYEKQLLIKESELQSLQSQVNPHFLFNVLETISWEARLMKNEKIYRMIVSLGQLLRASINMGAREKITISEELKYIEFYLYLQEIRFGDSLSVQVNVMDGCPKDCYLPKLCIQPIVENAIIHGLESKRGSKSIIINVKADLDIICFEIIDDGLGFNPEDIDLDNKDFIEYRKEGHKSIGLYNTNKRIKLMYGEEYGLSIISNLNVGTTITVRIPIDRSDV